VTVTTLSILSFVVVVLIGGIILVTVTFSKSLQKALDNSDRVHERVNKQLAEVLDRLMAKTFEEFKVYDLGEAAHGEIIYPETANDRPWSVPGQVQPGAGLAGGDRPIGVEEEESER
jgi:hypothetical protein